MFSRLAAAALVLALLIAATGLGWEYHRFGGSAAASASRLEREVRENVAAAVSDVQTLARRTAADERTVDAITGGDDRLPLLFSVLADFRASATGPDPVSVTVYVPNGMLDHRVLAWSDGPASDLNRERLGGPAALFVTPGTASVRLVYTQPIESGGRRVGVAVAEAVISRATAGEDFSIATALGPVSILPGYFGAGATQLGDSAFVVSDASGGVLLAAAFSPADLVARRGAFRRRVFAAAALPLAILPLFVLAGPIDRRRQTSTAGPWLAWTALAALTVMLSMLVVAWLVRQVGAPTSLQQCVLGAGTLGVAALIGGAWWRVGRRGLPARSPWTFVAVQLAGGIALAVVVAALVYVFRTSITSASLETWQSSLFPFDADRLLLMWSVLLAAIALCWMAAVVLAVAAERWRASAPRPRALIALVLWMTPITLVLTRPDWPRAPTAVLALAIAAFGLFAARLRRYYRGTTQSTRLLFGLLAIVMPLFATYPLVAVLEEQTTRQVIETEYAPAAARQPDQILAELAQAERDVDAQPVPVPPAPGDTDRLDTSSAFSVWTKTSLSRTRLVSDIELYGPNGLLVSRFAFNLPEYLYRANTERWSGSKCTWDEWGEVVPFGAEDRTMLHAERGLCDREGHLLGAVVLHVAPTDYEALPYLPSATVYDEVIGDTGGARTPSHVPDLQLVVYGWSLRPLFISARVAWSITESVFTRLYNPGTPFWTTLDADGRPYDVYFTEDRQGVYALGYPVTSAFEHAARLAEIVAVAAVVFVLIQIGRALYAPIVRRSGAPLGVFFHEVRTSFYRKLFLFFVFVAVGPVLLFAVAFSTYMTTRFRADEQKEAANVVTVARRVFQEIAAAEPRSGQEPAEPSDDVMVWIRQVIGQDVNLFEGASLVATSQRDLFASGLLPTRTLASVYRAVALDRLPTFVGEDRLGELSFLVAAAPLESRGAGAILTVPLAPRQVEIEQEIDELKRGVLVGVVFVVFGAALLGASLAGRVADPVARLTRATRLIAAGRFDVRIAADTADELRRLVDDFNTMAATLVAQRAALARANQLKAWNEMARQVAHEVKNPLTPIQLAAEHLQRVHADQGAPLGAVFEQCLTTILGQVRLLRQIASEFANFASEPVARSETFPLAPLVASLVEPYRAGLNGRVSFAIDMPESLQIVGDRTLLSRALTNLVENAIQAMPSGGTLTISGRADGALAVVDIQDSGVGMDEAAAARAFEPFFSTKTGGSGLGLANAKRNIERVGGTIGLASTPGRGTTVTLRLPLEAARPDASGGPAPAR